MRPACHSKYYVRRAGPCRENNALLHGKTQYYLTDVTQRMSYTEKSKLSYPNAFIGYPVLLDSH
jgi:hypothetical protein